MTVTINSDATSLIVTSELLTTAAANLTLDRRYGCLTTVLPVDVTGKVASVVNHSFNVSLANLYTTVPAKIEDGIHYFNLQYEFSSGVGETTFIEETFCLVVDYDLKCKLLKSKDQLLLDKYQALFYNYDCDACLCTTACKIYNDLVVELNLNPIPNGTTDCGCN